MLPSLGHSSDKLLHCFCALSILVLQGSNDYQRHLRSREISSQTLVMNTFAINLGLKLFTVVLIMVSGSYTLLL